MSEILVLAELTPNGVRKATLELLTQAREIGDTVEAAWRLSQGVAVIEMAAGADEFTLPVTQEELAAMVGASRERVNKAIASFVRLGWIEQSERRYRITDREQLERRAR